MPINLSIARFTIGEARGEKGRKEERRREERRGEERRESKKRERRGSREEFNEIAVAIFSSAVPLIHGLEMGSTSMQNRNFTMFVPSTCSFSNCTFIACKYTRRLFPCRDNIVKKFSATSIRDYFSSFKSAHRLPSIPYTDMYLPIYKVDEKSAQYVRPVFRDARREIARSYRSKSLSTSERAAGEEVCRSITCIL